MAFVVASSSGSSWSNELLMSHTMTAVQLNYPATTNTDVKKCSLMIPRRNKRLVPPCGSLKLCLIALSSSTPLVRYCSSRELPAPFILYSCKFGGLNNSLVSGFHLPVTTWAKNKEGAFSGHILYTRRRQSPKDSDFQSFTQKTHKIQSCLRMNTDLWRKSAL